MNLDRLLYREQVRLGQDAQPAFKAAFVRRLVPVATPHWTMLIPVGLRARPFLPAEGNECGIWPFGQLFLLGDPFPPLLL